MSTMHKAASYAISNGYRQVNKSRSMNQRAMARVEKISAVGREFSWGRAVKAWEPMAPSPQQHLTQPNDVVSRSISFKLQQRSDVKSGLKSAQ